MDLSIEIRQLNQIVILELSGRVSVPDLCLRRCAEGLLERGIRYFIINLANVTYMDNGGLGQLCWIYTVSRNRGGDMKLLRPTSRIRKLLSITKLDTIFQSFECEAEAVLSMQSQSMPLSISANGY